MFLEQLERVPEDYIDLFADVGEYYEGDFANNGKPKVLVIGDSLSADLINALVKGGAVEQIDLTGIRLYYPCLGVFPMTPKRENAITPRQSGPCRFQREQLLQQLPLIKQADAVILASYWSDMRVLPLLDSTTEYLKFSGR